MAHPNQTALAARVDALLGQPVAQATPAQIHALLATKCPRFVSSSAPIMPMMSPLYWARRSVENVPHTEIVGADGSVVAFAFGGAVSAVSMKRVAA